MRPSTKNYSFVNSSSGFRVKHLDSKTWVKEIDAAWPRSLQSQWLTQGFVTFVNVVRHWRKANDAIKDHIITVTLGLAGVRA